MSTSPAEWPAFNVERRETADLVPYARNSRTHSPEQIDKLAASIREWGWTNPCLISEDGTLIAGHGRLLAAHKLGAKEVPVIVARGWSEAQTRAYVIADNQLAITGSGWDADLLKLELGDLKLEGFDLALVGFGDDELSVLLADQTEGETDPDEIPDVPNTPTSEPGDIWILGRHRIACGSSTDAHTVEAVLAGVKPHLMVSDPPYGVNYDPSWREGARATGKVLNDDKASWRDAWVLFPGDVAYLWHGEKQCPDLAIELRECGFDVRNLIVWAKPSLVMGRGNYHSQHETCWYAVRKGATGHWEGDRKQTTLWHIAKKEDAKTIHGTQKPVECMKRPIENNSSPGQAVYEPFSGSGTTILAGEMTGRQVFAIELNELYVDVAVIRWQNFTAKPATLESTGETFDQVKERRSTGNPDRNVLLVNGPVAGDADSLPVLSGET